LRVKNLTTTTVGGLQKRSVFIPVMIIVHLLVYITKTISFKVYDGKRIVTTVSMSVNYV